MNLKFRKKPVVIEAFQMTKERRVSNADWPDWMHQAWQLDRETPGALYPTEKGTGDGTLSIGTLEGQHLVLWGDWIIRGVKGELYPCKPDIFDATYEKGLNMKQEVNFTIENGTTVKSSISGFTGMVTSRAQHLHGCNRYFVNPPVDKEGKLSDGYWFDEAELIVLGCYAMNKAEKEIKPPTLLRLSGTYRNAYPSCSTAEPQNTSKSGFHSKIK